MCVILLVLQKIACDDHKDYNILFKLPFNFLWPLIIHSRENSFPGYHLTQTFVITVVSVWAVEKP